MADNETPQLGFLIDDETVLQSRGPKNAVDPWKPYHYLVEEEFSRHRRLEAVLTVFLTNQECPFRCTMCDLWKNTLDELVPRGAIPAQIDYALQRLPASRKIKLYNSGNFFDPRAIPPEDYDSILKLLDEFDTLIVENHPRLCGARCLEFQERCGGRLEVALGLETVDPDVLQRLNKGMDLNDFDRAVERLLAAEVTVRSFVLLQPPFLSPEKSVESCLRTLEHAFSIGVDCCAVIPTRGGNGLMEKIQAEIGFQTPTLRQIEQVADEAFRWQKGRVLIDLWDIEQLAQCGHCRTRRIERLQQMNQTQDWIDGVEGCNCDVSVNRVI